MEDIPMIPRRPLHAIILCLVVAFFFAPISWAQSPVDPAQLPGRTIFYMLWRGAPAGDIRAKNSLYALWDDPDFAPARSAFLQSLQNNQTQKNKVVLTQEEAAQYSTLLDNPFLIGYLRQPESAHAEAASPAKSSTAGGKNATNGATAPTEKPKWDGMFFVYDRSGKEELLSKAVLRLRSTETEIPKLSNVTFAGVSALKVERKSETTYWGEFGKYAVSADEPSVFEEVVSLLNGKPAATTLSQSPAFVEAKPLLAGTLAEFFLNISSVKSFAQNMPSATAAQLKPFIDSLKLDTLHSVAGHVSLEGARMHMQMAILGDTEPGGLFDIFAAGQTTPASLSFFFPDTVYYSESQLDLLGIYKVLKRALTPAGGSSNSAGQVNLLESAAAQRLGMPVEDALGLTTGEFASLQTNPGFADKDQVYFLGVRKKDDALKLTRTLMGERVTSERNEGTTTFLKISLQGSQGGTGVAQWNFYHLAMTPNALLGSPKLETLQGYLEKSAARSDPAKGFQAARAQFPEKLSGMTYIDFQRLDWPALKAKWIADANKAAAQSAAKTAEAAKTTANPSWLTQLNPDVLPRHLHTLAGASWKDAKGVHIDEWLD
jgi:hypothetical protein